MPWPKGRPRSAETIKKLSGPRIPLEVRFWAKVHKGEPGECWLWTASTADGYGKIGVAGKPPALAHRVSWELLVGPIPPNMTVDHQCHNLDMRCPGGECRHRRCVNPNHLRLASVGENILAGKSLPAVNATKTHCDDGHEFTVTNTYVRPDGYRDCHRCKAIRQSEYLIRKRGHRSLYPSRRLTR